MNLHLAEKVADSTKQEELQEGYIKEKIQIITILVISEEEAVVLMSTLN